MMLNLVAGKAARSDGLGVMASAVESVVGGGREVDEADQRFLTRPASEAVHVPRR